MVPTGESIEKSRAWHKKTLYASLDESAKTFIDALSLAHQFTFQEFRRLVEVSRDLSMWGEEKLPECWARIKGALPPSLEDPELKTRLLKSLDKQINDLKNKPKVYRPSTTARKRTTELKLSTEKSEKNVFGDCPVASPKTVCCNLKTIDAVENCAFECSYCTIQTFYGDKVVFDSNFSEKLAKLELEPERFYHIGTGQSSDSLVWGNREGILDALCDFAAKHPNILLEFKTKSDQVDYFMTHTVPRNIVCSWSLNTETIVNEEEHFTATLQQRLAAARKVADRGIRVAFHFHPMVYYAGWQADYPELAQKVQAMFSQEEVLFLSFGSVTFIKPVIKEIRQRERATKILQMEMVKDPHGKLTYPAEVKTAQFRAMYKAFSPWHDSVFMYLCMEHASFWDEVFGWHYPTNEEFETDFGRKTMAKLP